MKKDNFNLNKITKSISRNNGNKFKIDFAMLVREDFYNDEYYKEMYYYWSYCYYEEKYFENYCNLDLMSNPINSTLSVSYFKIKGRKLPIHQMYREGCKLSFNCKAIIQNYQIKDALLWSDLALRGASNHTRTSRIR